MSLADFLLSLGLWVAVFLGFLLLIGQLVVVGLTRSVSEITGWGLTGVALLVGSAGIIIYKFRRSNPD